VAQASRRDGRSFESRGEQDVVMRGYLGFGLPAALGAWAATRGQRQLVAICG